MNLAANKSTNKRIKVRQRSMLLHLVAEAIFRFWEERMSQTKF